MANDGDGNVRHRGGNRSLEELRIAHANLEHKVDGVSQDIHRILEVLGNANENLRYCKARARPNREARLSLRENHVLRRARRREIPAPPELSESDEGGIRHRRYRGRDSSTYEEVQQWILGEPRFAAQPSHHNSVTKYKPPNHRFTNIHEIQIDLPHNHYTQSQFSMTHENQTETTKTHTHFSHETYRGISLGAWSDTATNRKLKHLNSIKLHFDPTMSNESLSNSQFIGKAKEINIVKDIHNRGMNNVQSKMEETIKGFFDVKVEMMSKIEMLDEVMLGECVEFENANESLDLFDKGPLDTIVGDKYAFCQAHE
ncbi:hypothetical protein LWI29_032672 [Acer saccharum]|uniref:Uncharacterized protein n=1 Tax=Acer saccharum TaxID=4024 RepID=A0AA39W7G7_ACESA|nr:hypothetical protein LWI29_032672 [Acer saccharum]